VNNGFHAVFDSSWTQDSGFAFMRPRTFFGVRRNEWLFIAILFCKIQVAARRTNRESEMFCGTVRDD
jgi:hypothetical protein